LQVWDEGTNTLYKELFEVDYSAISKRLGKKIQTKISSWTRMLVIEDVTSETIAANAKLLLLDLGDS
jgi:hypothetical protein